MIAIGCLSLIVLPLIGLIIGQFLGGPEGALWGAGVGFAIAAAFSAIMTYALVKAGHR